jgi:hypothetical protein
MIAVILSPQNTHLYGSTHVYTPRHTYTHVHARTHTCTHTLFLSYTHKYPRNSRAHTYIHEHQGYIRTHTQVHAAHTQTSIQAHTDIPTYAHAPKHTYMHTHTHTNTNQVPINNIISLSLSLSHTHTHNTHTHTHMTKKSDSPIVRFWPLQDLESGKKCFNVFKVQSHWLSILCSSVHKYEIDSKFSPSYFQVSV